MTLEGIDQPTNKRPNYFAGQYLLEDDFQLEQQYHIDRQRRHNRLLHISGIADGLTVSQPNGLTVNITKGTAIDNQGRQIVQLEDKALNLFEIADDGIKQGEQLKDANYILSVGYSCELSDKQGTDDITSTRLVEIPQFKLSLSEPTENIKLVKLTISNNNVTNIDDSIREYSGLRLPSSSDKPLMLRSGGDRASNLAVLSGSLSVTDQVGIGTTTPTEKLEISGGNLKVSGNISASNATLTGNVGIGTPTSGIKLEVKGSTNDYTAAGLNVIDVNAKSLLYVRNDGSVGIGTTTPGGKLNIIDSFQNAIGTTLILGSTDASNLRLGYDQEYSWIQSHGGKPLAINSLGNNVGIGTTDPKQQLVVNGGKASIGCNDAQQTAALAVNGNVGIGTITPTVKLEVSGGDLKVSGNISANNANLSSNLSVTGNVGIGTTSPAAKLQVRDTIANRGTYDFSKTALLVNSQTHNGGNSPAEAESVLALAREGVSGQTFGNMVDFRLSNHQNAGTQLDLYLTKQGTFLPQQVMSLRANGTVGIGTTNPTEKLEISDGNLKVSGNIYATNAALTGNITIGETSLFMIEEHTILADNPYFQRNYKTSDWVAIIAGFGCTYQSKLTQGMSIFMKEDPNGYWYFGADVIGVLESAWTVKILYINRKLFSK